MKLNIVGFDLFINFLTMLYTYLDLKTRLYENAVILPSEEFYLPTIALFVQKLHALKETLMFSHFIVPLIIWIEPIQFSPFE